MACAMAAGCSGMPGEGWREGACTLHGEADLELARDSSASTCSRGM